MTATIEVIDTFEAVVQDAGRPNGDRFALPRSGASDLFSFRAANILVGNPENTPAVELTNTAFSWRSDEDLLVAVTGADVTVKLNGEVMVYSWRPLLIVAGSTVEVSEPHRGYRAYVAFRGGIDAPRRFGSVAPLLERDFATVLGPGSRLIVLGGGDDFSRTTWSVPSTLMVDAIRQDLLGEEKPIAVRPGPNMNMFDDLHLLYQEQYEMTPRSNAIGVRLSGETPRRSDPTEVLSRTIPIGSIEIPSTGEVIILLRSRLLTAGYPVPAVVVRADLERAAQLRPGAVTCFREVSENEAYAALLRQEVWLNELAAYGPPVLSRDMSSEEK